MTKTEIPLILNEDEYEIIDAFMKFRAGRTFDMRTREGRLIHRILRDIQTYWRAYYYVADDR